ncbi:MAG: sodium:proton antiporter NhaD [Bacteroidales bacterium]|jgi:Na+/H+ antiporter NhaD/arsenite permease-like protein|nr:sodium:proton antiporter NhaD [Bacteroidales bacterium]
MSTTVFVIIVVVFILGYCCIALEHPLKINKSATALLLAVILWSIYALFGGFHDSETLFTALGEEIKLRPLIEHLGDTAEILFFLLGAMTIVETVDKHGGFAIITDQIRTTNKRKLLWIIAIITFFMSAALDNLTTSIVMVALLRKLVEDKKDRWFFAGMVILAANAGGAWSPIGDVTTIMLWIKGNITASMIIKETFIPSLVSMVVPLAIISLTMKGSVKRPAEKDSAVTLTASKLQSNIVFFLGVGSLLFTPIFKTITHLPPYMGILLGLGLIWVVTEILHRHNADKYSRLNVSSILQKVDTPSVLFFLGILMAVACLQDAGHLKLLAQSLDSIGNIYVINVIIGALSSVVDNVPLVAAAMGMYPLAEVGHYAVDGAFWEMLAYCAGTGGSMLIIGSAAGVAVMGMEKIDFIWYLKKISLWALLGYLAGAGTFYLMSHFLLHS